jgi:hypothetical protein
MPSKKGSSDYFGGIKGRALAFGRPKGVLRYIKDGQAAVFAYTLAIFCAMTALIAFCSESVWLWHYDGFRLTYVGKELYIPVAMGLTYVFNALFFLGYFLRNLLCPYDYQAELKIRLKLWEKEEARALDEASQKETLQMNTEQREAFQKEALKKEPLNEPKNPIKKYGVLTLSLIAGVMLYLSASYALHYMAMSGTKIVSEHGITLKVPSTWEVVPESRAMPAHPYGTVPENLGITTIKEPGGGEIYLVYDSDETRNFNELMNYAKADPTEWRDVTISTQIINGVEYLKVRELNSVSGEGYSYHSTFWRFSPNTDEAMTVEVVFWSLSDEEQFERLYLSIVNSMTFEKPVAE